jgi:hypothetical protein
MSRTEEILNQELPRLAPAAASEPFNFIYGVIEFLVRWCSTYPAPPDLSSEAYCCFVGFDRVADAIKASRDFAKRPFFRDDTPQDLLGCIYFSSLTCSSVFSLKSKLRSFADCEALINTLGVAGQPVILFNAADRKLLWRIDPKSEPRHQVLRREPAPKLTSAEFDQALKDFHYEFTVAPQGLTKPWENATQLLTKRDLEAEVRDDLFLHLRSLMQDQVAVIREFYSPAGRTDLLVVFRMEKVVLYVELKVLRAFEKKDKSRRAVPEQETISWGKKGIAQAFNYKRSNTSVGTAYACCFDGRAEDREIDELINYAKRMNVEYRRFYMYSSAELYHASVMES